MGTGVLVVFDEELARCQGEDLLCVVIRARVSMMWYTIGPVMPRTMTRMSLHEAHDTAKSAAAVSTIMSPGK
jgi:hypothetical protein